MTDSHFFFFKRLDVSLIIWDNLFITKTTFSYTDESRLEIEHCWEWNVNFTNMF